MAGVELDESIRGLAALLFVTEDPAQFEALVEELRVLTKRRVQGVQQSLDVLPGDATARKLPEA